MKWNYRIVTRSRKNLRFPLPSRKWFDNVNLHIRFFISFPPPWPRSNPFRGNRRGSSDKLVSTAAEVNVDIRAHHNRVAGPGGHYQDPREEKKPIQYLDPALMLNTNPDLGVPAGSDQNTRIRNPARNLRSLDTYFICQTDLHTLSISPKWVLQRNFGVPPGFCKGECSP